MIYSLMESRISREQKLTLVWIENTSKSGFMTGVSKVDTAPSGHSQWCVSKSAIHLYQMNNNSL